MGAASHSVGSLLLARNFSIGVGSHLVHGPQGLLLEVQDPFGAPCFHFVMGLVAAHLTRIFFRLGSVSRRLGWPPSRLRRVTRTPVWERSMTMPKHRSSEPQGKLTYTPLRFPGTKAPHYSPTHQLCRIHPPRFPGTKATIHPILVNPRGPPARGESEHFWRGPQLPFE